MRLRKLPCCSASVTDTGARPAALFDLPWMPLYLGFCFAFHFLLGVTALAGLRPSVSDQGDQAPTSAFAL